MSILDQIIEHKKSEVGQRKKLMPLGLLKERLHQFDQQRSLMNKFKENTKFHFICEIKKASPSRGIIQPNFDPLRMAQIYTEGGVSAISVLTDERFFGGRLDYLSAVRQFTSLPILRKDFIIDPYQIYESKAAGADLILLIAKILSAQQIAEFKQLAVEVNLEILLELHDENDLNKLPKKLNKHLVLGVNNRNLNTFQVDFKNSQYLKQLLPPAIPVIAESGIQTAEDCRKFQSFGFNGALIGETLMKSSDPAQTLRDLLNGVKDADAA